MADAFTPTIYLKHTCPFCLKLIIYLEEAGILNDFRLEILEPESPEFEAAKAKLAPHFDSVSFPTIEIEPGVFRNETDALIAHYEAQTGKKAADFPLLNYYLTGVFVHVRNLFLENKKLKEAAAANA